jgi:8-oxo-dGTP pyrophosphatase MutT (NUDIX family)
MTGYTSRIPIAIRIRDKNFKQMNHKTFNIRVYGLFMSDKNQILLTDEYRLNMHMTKFPGGGLEYGEGTIDCLKRECREELLQEPFDIGHFYTTDYFQPTRYLDKQQQLLSIYYTGKLEKPYAFQTTQKKFDFPAEDGMQAFRWVDIAILSPQEMTMPIDRHVVNILKEYYA